MPDLRFGFTLLEGNAGVVSSDNFRRTFLDFEEAHDYAQGIPAGYYAIVLQSGQPVRLHGRQRSHLVLTDYQESRRGHRRRRKGFGAYSADTRAALLRAGRRRGWSDQRTIRYVNESRNPIRGVLTPDQDAIFREPMFWEDYIRRNRARINDRYGEGVAEALLAAAFRQKQVSMGARVLDQEIALYVSQVDVLAFPTARGQLQEARRRQRAYRKQRQHGR